MNTFQALRTQKAQREQVLFPPFAYSLLKLEPRTSRGIQPTDESEDQVSEISRRNIAAAVGQNVDGVAPSGVFGITIEVAEVLHRHERFEEERVEDDLLLNEGSQRLRSAQLFLQSVGVSRFYQNIKQG